MLLAFFFSFLHKEIEIYLHVGCIESGFSVSLIYSGSVLTLEITSKHMISSTFAHLLLMNIELLTIE